ncbi:hypothetical protein PpBr36_03760 [Pyricularia pennisetigena]|uniref:hypothetical protein n=1 Tax=Pyricularia pennisetigena TaxID=1578925 RepID=UPI0011538FC7|nr:hypothetical protein PpBr36_03760 [Pyricularia pennisetigena]TLS31162.1 hypothetical protein PpBr36_03760 [Pyricularia pennisetigena]
MLRPADSSLVRRGWSQLAGPRKASNRSSENRRAVCSCLKERRPGFRVKRRRSGDFFAATARTYQPLCVAPAEQDAAGASVTSHNSDEAAAAKEIVCCRYLKVRRVAESRVGGRAPQRAGATS